MNECRDVLVFGDARSGKLGPMTIQLLSIGRKLANTLGHHLRLLVLGKVSSTNATEGYSYGADDVLVARDPSLENYVGETYLKAMEEILRLETPFVILFGHDDIGMDLAPRLAFRLKTGVTLDCVDLQIDVKTKTLKQLKPVFGGEAECLYAGGAGGPVIVTVRDNSFEKAVFDKSREGVAKEIHLSLDPSTTRVRFLGRRTDESQSLGQTLRTAHTVISGGRGIGGAKGFDRLKETAEILGGCVAGSRAAVDYGWVPRSLQVGLTGHKIAPKLYIAAGISGSIQHMAGCLKSKVIIGINTDKEAPIFKFSHFGVVGDYDEVLSGFNDECRRELGTAEGPKRGCLGTPS